MTQIGTKFACAPVLLIEDEPALMALVRAVLEGYGFRKKLRRGAFFLNPEA